MLDFIVRNADPFLFHIGNFGIRWYSLAFMIGFLVGYEIEARIYKHEGAPEKWLSLLLLWTIAGTIIGARLGHVFFYQWDLYRQDPISILYMREGGLASHGGTIGIVLCIIMYSIFTTKRSPPRAFDRPGDTDCACGRTHTLGNLMNSEIFGHSTDLPGASCLCAPLSGTSSITAGLPPDADLRGSVLFRTLRPADVDVLEKNAEERPGLIFGVFFIGIFLPRFLIEFIKNPGSSSSRQWCSTWASSSAYPSYSLASD